MPERICAIGRDGDAWARVLTAMAASMPVGRPSGAFALQRRALKGVNGALLSRAGMLSAGAASLRSGLTPIAVFRSGAGCQPTRIVEEPYSSGSSSTALTSFKRRSHYADPSLGVRPASRLT